MARRRTRTSASKARSTGNGLDWSGEDGISHWGGGQRRPCRVCGNPAFLVDDDGRPCHKVCAETEARTAAAAAASAIPA
ncbi:hypothetical protein [Nonomuraea sediminis]|uniref:hypothetical protein n=1 Tax=Nonomuraea sediminis TaxID=2835864 RepID=UPI001BDCCB01|nr:hypothetical protein [Nonomuraea sediminis]